MYYEILFKQKMIIDLVYSKSLILFIKSSRIILIVCVTIKSIEKDFQNYNQIHKNILISKHLLYYVPYNDL